jgi:hypothetical protein
MKKAKSEALHPSSDKAVLQGIDDSPSFILFKNQKPDLYSQIRVGKPVSFMSNSYH